MLNTIRPLAALALFQATALAQRPPAEPQPLPWASLEERWVMVHYTADQLAERERGRNPVGESYPARLETAERLAASVELKALEGEPDDRAAAIRSWATVNLNQRLEYPRYTERLEDLIVRSTVLTARDQRAQGELEAALDVLTWPIEFREQFVDLARDMTLIGALTPSSHMAREEPGPKVLALAERVYRDPELATERAAVQAQLVPEGQRPFQFEILDSRLAAWHFERFGPLDPEIYEAVADVGQTGSPALEWERSACFARVAEYDWGRIPPPDDQFSKERALAALRSDPEGLVELDALLSRRWGGPYDRSAGRALWEFINTGSPVPVRGLAPMFTRLLASPSLDSDLARRELVRALENAIEREPELIDAMLDAALQSDFSRAADIVLPWVDLERVLSGGDWGIDRRDDEFNSVIGRLLEHDDRDVRYAAARTVQFDIHFTGRLLDFDQSEDLRERELALEALLWRLDGRQWAPNAIWNPQRLASALGRLSRLPGAPEKIVETINQVDSEVIWAAAIRAVEGQRLVQLLERAKDWLKVRSEPHETELDRAILEVIEADPSADVVAGLLRLRPVQAGNVIEGLLKPLVQRAIEADVPVTRDALDDYLGSAQRIGEVWFEALAYRLREPANWPEGQGLFNRVAASAINAGQPVRAALVAVQAREPRVASLCLLNLLAAALSSPPLHRSSSLIAIEELFDSIDQDESTWLLRELALNTYRNGGYSSLDAEKWEERLQLLPDHRSLAARVCLDSAAPFRLRLGAASLVPADDPRARECAVALLEAYRVHEGPFSLDDRGALEGMRFPGQNAYVVEWLDSQDASSPDARASIVKGWLEPKDPGAYEAARAIFEAELRRVDQPMSIDTRALSQVFEASEDHRDEIVELVERALRTESGEYGVYLAGRLSWPEFIPAIAALIEHPSHARRLAAISALRKFPEDPRAAEAVRKGMLDDVEQVREMAAEVIEQWKLVRAAAVGLESVPSADQARAELFGMLESPEPAVRAEAARGLATMGAVEALPRLIRMLADEDPSVREAVRGALDRLHQRTPDTDPEEAPEEQSAASGN